MSSPWTVVVTGASRGIGLELTRQYAERGCRVFATCRDPASAGDLQALSTSSPGVEILALDVTDAGQIDSLAAKLEREPLDLLLNNAGVYGRKRLALSEIEPEEWLSVMATNTVAPLLVTRALLPGLRIGRGRRVAMMSSKVGSVSDNSSGGNYAYRTSKAALNQVVKNLSIELAPDGIVVVALHPGWVRTEMGGPNALIEVEESVRGLRAVIDGLGATDSGSFLAYDGSPIGW